eukprot:CAMPEP_0171086914 /NCGR_PEP_ID=MMETSP0766_2-20121228/19832_1 /TAXON_ID=439317 /ORGANISM="Gambierdiscus australes, Strain CAWD 149" /LENGTH=215 /DNA_ID=CAMNT_0011544587 /DNA_START=350 /DNA_END=995 /DNA_ORIENTATION=-
MVPLVETKLNAARILVEIQHLDAQPRHVLCRLCLCRQVDESIDTESPGQGLRFNVSTPCGRFSKALTIPLEATLHKRRELALMRLEEGDALGAVLEVAGAAITLELVRKGTEETCTVCLHLLAPKAASAQQLVVVPESALPSSAWALLTSGQAATSILQSSWLSSWVVIKRTALSSSGAGSAAGGGSGAWAAAAIAVPLCSEQAHLSQKRTEPFA